MDVIALDRAGIAEVVAPNGTAVTEAQLERMWRLDPAADPAASTATAPGGRPRSAPPFAPSPTSGPSAPCASSSCLPGQDPDDLVRSGGREAVEALLAAPEPLVERLWRHEVEAAPSTRPKPAPASSSG